MQKIYKQIQQYSTDYQEELFFKNKMLFLLEKKAEKAFSRKSADAHFTASAWLIDKGSKRILLLKHNKLDKWLQAGGHADGLTNLEQVARKEAAEETNLKELSLISDGIFDIDIHTIPRRDKIKEHEHFDVRYAFMVNDLKSTKINSESKEFKWLTIDEVELITSNPSIIRMVNKTKQFF